MRTAKLSMMKAAKMLVSCNKCKGPVCGLRRALPWTTSSVGRDICRNPKAHILLALKIHYSSDSQKGEQRHSIRAQHSDIIMAGSSAVPDIDHAYSTKPLSVNSCGECIFCPPTGLSDLCGAGIRLNHTRAVRFEAACIPGGTSKLLLYVEPASKPYAKLLRTMLAMLVKEVTVRMFRNTWMCASHDSRIEQCCTIPQP